MKKEKYGKEKVNMFLHGEIQVLSTSCLYQFRPSDSGVRGQGASPLLLGDQTSGDVTGRAGCCSTVLKSSASLRM